jgi:trehalose/maltose transport system permease protein
MKARSFAGGALFALLVIVVLVVVLFPFYWMIVNSLKGASELFETPVRYWPQRPSLRNYVQIFTTHPFGRNLLNSLVVAGGATAVSIVLGGTAAYALGRYRFRGRGAILNAILAMSTFPQIAILSGLFFLVRALGLYNSHGALVFSYLIFTLPFTVWVLTNFIKQIPDSLPEAALVDGATPLQVLVRVIAPIMAPAVVTTALLAFINGWNEFLFALSLTVDGRARTASVAIALFSGQSEHELPWGLITAASAVVCLPVIVLTLLFQEKIVAGLTAGSVKE